MGNGKLLVDKNEMNATQFVPYFLNKTPDISEQNYLLRNPVFGKNRVSEIQRDVLI
jgi:hypothetical protein